MNKLEKIESIFQQTNQPKYRLDQVKKAVYQNGARSYSEITNIPLELREILEKELGPVLSLKELHKVEGTQVQKVLLETIDGQRIESVLIIYQPNKERKHSLYSVCVSSQAGCGMGCKFCATGAIGFKRNLTPDEIVDQVLVFKQKGIEVSNIIFMGMGEPFANIDNVFEAVKMLTDPNLVGLSPRKISISTVGVVPGIERLATEFPNVNLALSLHSPFQKEREEIMPVTKAYSIAAVMKAVNFYVEKTNNKVFISYLLLGGANDDVEHAEALYRLIRNQGAKSYLYHVNLIRFNPIPGSDLPNGLDPPSKSVPEFNSTTAERIKKFQETLEKHHITSTLRQNFGVEIDAACGQLYAKYSNKEQNI
jgi:23S rRNA (adenine-C8)-methyltransferase